MDNNSKYIQNITKLVVQIDNDISLLDYKINHNSIEYLIKEDSTIDYQSFIRAKKLLEINLINEEDVGTFVALKRIHEYLFVNLYDFAGKLRNVNMSKGNTMFASVAYLSEVLNNIDRLPQSNFDEIIDKYIGMNIAHPFRDGNGRSIRIWLDMILKKELMMCIDWSMIEKLDYLNAMQQSVYSSTDLRELLKNALTDKIEDRIIFIKGIEKSYYYEIDKYK